MKQIILTITVFFTFLLIVPATAANDDIIVESGYKVPITGERHDPIPVSWWQFQILIIIGQLSLMPAEIITGAKTFTYLGYKAITDNNVMGNGTRLKILDYIKKNPGVSFSVISREINVNRGTLSYHLKTLKIYHKINISEYRGRKRYFENHSKFSDAEQRILQYLKLDTSRRIIEHLIEHPGISRNNLSNAIEISGSAVTQYMEDLHTDGIIKIEKVGQFNKYYVNAKVVQIMRN